MIDFRIGTALLALFLGTLTGCSTIANLRSSPLPDGYAIGNFAKVDAGHPFAINRTGTVAAIVEGTLQLIPHSGAPGLSIAPAPATALSFSPDDTRLAAVFATPAQSVLQLFDLQGKLAAEAIVPGKVTSIAWRSGNELLATALAIKKFSFGSELTATLYRWDTVAPPVATLLNDVTVRPGVAKLPDAILFGSLTMALSPYGDEIAYSALKDPPVFTPYLRTVVRHLESGAEREVAETGLGSGGSLYAPDGESLVTGDAGGLTRRISVPNGKEIDAWSASGDRIAISPSGSYLLLDGRLFWGGREVTSFPREAIGAFLPDGSGLAISNGGMLFLVAGLRDSPPPARPSDLKRILELRRLRMLGLITDKEFKARKAKVSAP